MKKGVKKAFVFLMASFMLISVLPFFVDASEPEKKDVIVGFKDKINSALIRSYNGKIAHELDEINVIAASLPDSAIKALKKNKNVEYVEIDGEVKMAAETLPWGVDRIDAEVVWGGSEDALSVTGNGGSGVQVAVVDTGIDYTHPDLDDNYISGYDYVNNDNDPKDDNGHGTHCAGIIGAEDNTEGVIGVAPEVDLYAIKVLDNSGRGAFSDVAAGILWAAKGPNGVEGDSDDAEVVSISLGGGDDNAVSDAIEYAYNHGTLPVAAAGNGGNEYVIYPAKYPGAIAVSATNDQDSLTSFSSYGDEVEQSAPGVDVYSTMPTYTVELTKGQYKYSKNYDEMSGTSMACPHVSGVAALVFAAGATDSNDEGDNVADDVRRILNESAEDLGDSGWDKYYGYGLVDAVEAEGDVQSGDPTVDITYPIDGSEVSGSVTITASATDSDGSVNEVEFFVDGSSLGTDSDGSDGWSYGWTSSSVSDGSHTIKAVATDNDLKTASDSITVTTENTDDPPTVYWVNPKGGDTVTGTITIQISASDDRDSGSSLTVQWQVDDGTWQTASYNSGTGYYEDSWNSNNVNDDSHNLDARATDAGSNIGTEERIAVTVSNSVGGMYVWDISWATAGPHLKGTVTILYDSDNDGISESTDSPASGASLEFTISVDSDNDGEYDDDSNIFTGTTDSNGQVAFMWKQAPSGDFKGEVTSLTHPTYEWNSGLDADNPSYYS